MLKTGWTPPLPQQRPATTLGDQTRRPTHSLVPAPPGSNTKSLSAPLSQSHRIIYPDRPSTFPLGSPYLESLIQSKNGKCKDPESIPSNHMAPRPRSFSAPPQWKERPDTPSFFPRQRRDTNTCLWNNTHPCPRLRLSHRSTNTTTPSRISSH